MRPSVLDYTDYRRYLRDAVAFVQSTQPRWSYGMWARRLKLSSRSTLVMILNGQRNPSPSLVDRMSDYFSMSKHESGHFKSLVEIGKKTSDPTLRLLLLEAVQKNNRGIETVNLWSVLFLRELLSLFPTGLESEDFYRNVQGHLDRARFLKATGWMVDQGLMQRSGNRLVVPLENNFQAVLSQSMNAAAVSQFHQDVMNSTKQAFAILNAQERIFKTSFLRVRAQDWTSVQSEVESFQKNLTKKYDSELADQILEINLQAFPLISIPRSKKVEKE